MSPVHLKPGHVPPPYEQQQFDRLIDYWKVIAAAQNYPHNTDAYTGDEAIAACKKYLDHPSKVLFLGCGDGTEVRRAIDELGHDAWGVTLNPNNIYHASEVLGLDHVYYHDAHLNPPDWAGQFDAVMGFQFLEHSTSPILMLMEADRLLRCKGILYFETPGTLGWTMDDNLHHLTVPTSIQARGWLLKTGWSHIDVQEIGPLDAARHLAIYARKPCGQGPWP